MKALQNTVLSLALLALGTASSSAFAEEVDPATLYDLNTQGFGPGTGFWGLFDAEDAETATALIAQAEAWLKGKGMTLAQVKAAQPTLDFDGRYGSTTGAWTTDMFVEAVYRTVPGNK